MEGKFGRMDISLPVSGFNQHGRILSYVNKTQYVVIASERFFERKKKDKEVKVHYFLRSRSLVEIYFMGQY